jgi:hypothetical protein
MEAPRVDSIAYFSGGSDDAACHSAVRGDSWIVFSGRWPRERELSFARNDIQMTSVPIMVPDNLDIIIVQTSLGAPLTQAVCLFVHAMGS